MADEIEISRLIPHPRNSDFFDDMSGTIWSEFLESIRINGVQQSITITKDNIIVAGHQRVRACQALDIEKIPYTVQEYKANGDITEDDAILLALIDTNLKQRSGGNPNPVKLALCFRELERIYGIRQGSAGNEGTKRHVKSPDGNNFRGKTQRSLADEYGMDERQYRNIKKLCDVIPELQAMIESEEISPTTVYIVWAKYSITEQLHFYKTIGQERVASMTADETKKQLKKLKVEMEQVKNNDVVVMKQEFQRQLEDRDVEIERLQNQKPRKAVPEDYEGIKLLLESALQENVELKAQCEAVKKLVTTILDSNTSIKENHKCFLIPCAIDEVPRADVLDLSEERDRLLEAYPNRLISEIPELSGFKRFVYRALERCLGLTDDNNELRVSYDDYKTHICDYGEEDFSSISALIQRATTKKLEEGR